MTETRTTLDPDALGQAAIAKLLAKEPTVKGVSLPPGRYEFDTVVTLRVHGEVLRSKDTDYTPTADIPLLPTMALLLQRIGWGKKKAEQVLIECAAEAISMGEEVGPEIAEHIKRAEETLATLKARLSAGLPKKSRKGATTFRGDVEVKKQSTMVHSA